MKHKIVAVAFTVVSLVYSNQTFPQWEQTDGIYGGEVHSLATLGNSIFAGTWDGVYLSTNNGTNWIKKNQGFNVIPIVNALLVTNNYIFTGTYGNSVWRRNISEIIGIQNISTEIPQNFKLEQNYPNPFNPSTNIKFCLPVTGQVLLKVYDALGREITTLVNEKLTPGTYTVDWNASQSPSGLYFYRFQTEGFTETKRMILTK